MTRSRAYAAAAVLAVALLVGLIRSAGGGSGRQATEPTIPPVGATSSAPTAAASEAATSPATPPPTRPAATSAPATTTPHRAPPPAATGPTVRWTDPVSVATHWVNATCNYTWRDPYTQHAATQAAYSTPAFRRGLSQDGPAGWQHNVVDRRTVATCRTVTASRIPAAPNTAGQAYIRVYVDQTAAPDGTTAAPERTSYPLKLARVADRWLVDGYAVGG